MILTHGANSLARGDDNIIYETDFSNFDFANKIDYPKVGPTTSYNNSKLYSSDSDGFVITGNGANVGTTNGITFDISNNDVELESSIYMIRPTGSTPSFIWLNSFGFDCGNARTTYEILIANTHSYTTYNGTTLIRNSDGFYWLNTDVSLAFAKLNVKFENGSAAMYLNDVLKLTIDSAVPTSQSFLFDPRMTWVIKSKYVTIKKI